MSDFNHVFLYLNNSINPMQAGFLSTDKVRGWSNEKFRS